MSTPDHVQTTELPTSPADQSRVKSQRPRKPNYNYIHRNLLPLDIYPLPVLIPHNPLSLLAIALSYLTQVLSPPLQPTYDGYFSSSTSSIHVTDVQTIRKLWEMGFFGRGSLSRSEPTWLESQKGKGATSEEYTSKRRAERRQQKLVRARKEQETIAERMLEERKPTGDGCKHALKINSCDLDHIASVLEDESGTATPVGTDRKVDCDMSSYDQWKRVLDVDGLPTPPPTTASSEYSVANGEAVPKPQRTKTVRFSPTMEAREFDLSSPVISPIKSEGVLPAVTIAPKTPAGAENQEHLQLSFEEAFFLSYSLGILRIFCDDTESVMPPVSLLSLFRRHSYFPPRSLSVPAEPDDPFMLSYAAYHHYRSLGWVVRAGVKFAVDYLLYNRGPAFSHAEFAIILLPSYSHSYWSETEEQKKRVGMRTRKSWWWLHGVNRVQAQVMKSLVLCYVDVPPPLRDSEKSDHLDIGRLFSRYNIRDVCLRRWTPNRTRD